MIFHPTQSRLHGFADGELIKKVRVKTAAHLERCSKCRNTVGWLRRLSREANALPLPTPPPELRDRILESLRRGDRVILPVADPPRPAWPGRRVAAGFSAIVAVAIGASLIRAPELASEASELRFYPEPSAARRRDCNRVPRHQHVCGGRFADAPGSVSHRRRREHLARRLACVEGRDTHWTGRRCLHGHTAAA